jgi:hypothetical protein
VSRALNRFELFIFKDSGRLRRGARAPVPALPGMVTPARALVG